MLVWDFAFSFVIGLLSCNFLWYSSKFMEGEFVRSVPIFNFFVVEFLLQLKFNLADICSWLEKRCFGHDIAVVITHWWWNNGIETELRLPFDKAVPTTLESIGTLEQFIVKHRKDYVDHHRTTEHERDSIEQEVSSETYFLGAILFVNIIVITR